MSLKNNNKLKTVTLIAGNYPAPGHVSLVFVQQLVHAIIEQGVMVTVVAPQSLIHALFRGEKLLPKKSKGYTESGVEYDIYRPYSISFGRHHYFKKITGFLPSHYKPKKHIIYGSN